jgi:hypothetical protein
MCCRIEIESFSFCLFEFLIDAFRSTNIDFFNRKKASIKNVKLLASRFNENAAVCIEETVQNKAATAIKNSHKTRKQIVIFIRCINA